MTFPKRLCLIAGLCCTVPFAFAQGPLLVLQPVITDSTTLFFAPDMEWRCAPPIGGLRPLQDTDFADVERCECRRVKYEQALDAWNRYYRKQFTLELRATLTRTSETTFTYTELDPLHPTQVTRFVPMEFDRTRVVRTDTTYASPMFAIPDSVVAFRITKFIELKAK